MSSGARDMVLAIAREFPLDAHSPPLHTENQCVVVLYTKPLGERCTYVRHSAAEEVLKGLEYTMASLAMFGGHCWRGKPPRGNTRILLVFLSIVKADLCSHKG